MNLAQAYLVVSDKIPVADIKVRQRLDRGYDIVRCNGEGYSIEQIDGEEIWKSRTYKATFAIHKASTSLLEDNRKSYIVTVEGCSCPDYYTARGNLCKHRLAVMLVTEMNKEG